jgi:hypothetical protein
MEKFQFMDKRKKNKSVDFSKNFNRTGYGSGYKFKKDNLTNENFFLIDDKFKSPQNMKSKLLSTTSTGFYNNNNSNNSKNIMKNTNSNFEKYKDKEKNWSNANANPNSNINSNTLRKTGQNFYLNQFHKKYEFENPSSPLDIYKKDSNEILIDYKYHSNGEIMIDPIEKKLFQEDNEFKKFEVNLKMNKVRKDKEDKLKVSININREDFKSPIRSFNVIWKNKIIHENMTKNVFTRQKNSYEEFMKKLNDYENFQNSCVKKVKVTNVVLKKNPYDDANDDNDNSNNNMKNEGDVDNYNFNNTNDNKNKNKDKDKDKDKNEIKINVISPKSKI